MLGMNKEMTNKLCIGRAFQLRVAIYFIHHTAMNDQSERQECRSWSQKYESASTEVLVKRRNSLQEAAAIGSWEDKHQKPLFGADFVVNSLSFMVVLQPKNILQ